MISSLRARQRGDVGLFADGLQSWLGGGKGVNAEAAGLNLAEILLCLANSVTEGKFTK